VATALSGREDPVDEPEDPDGEPPAGLGGDRHGAGRNRRRRRIALPVAIVAVLVVVAVVVAILVSRGGGLPADAAFSYDGKVTTVADFNAQVGVLNKLNGVTPPAANDPAHPAFLRSAAKSLAVTQMVQNLAAKRGISVSDKTIRDGLDQEVTTNYGGDQNKFNQALSAAGITEAQVLAALKAQQVENQLFSKVTKKVTVTPAQVTAAFNANQASLAVPEQRAVSHIVVASQDTANSILAQLQGGASFATLAQQDSLDTQTKANAGALGTVAASQLKAPFGPAAFAATLNVPFGPIAEQGGAFDIGLVTAITPAVTYGNDAQTQSGISAYLSDQQLLQQWNAYLSAQLKKADIHYAATYRPTQPFTPPAANLPAMVAFVANAHSGTATSSGPTASGSNPATGGTP
jgi:parvulin-like peptidyl-prolyl isomerase